MNEVTRQAHGILVKARELLSDENHWIKGTVTDGGKRFCAVGAVQYVGRYMNYEVSMLLEHLLRDAMPKGYPASHIPTFNDDPHTTHADVLAMFDRAIAVCKGTEVAEEPKPVVTYETVGFIPNSLFIEVPQAVWKPVAIKAPEPIKELVPA
jgi:hypothetical protein